MRGGLARFATPRLYNPKYHYELCNPKYGGGTRRTYGGAGKNSLPSMEQNKTKQQNKDTD